MLREQVRAMEKISAVNWSQTSPKRVVEKFVQLSAKLIPCDRITLWPRTSLRRASKLSLAVR